MATRLSFRIEGLNSLIRNLVAVGVDVDDLKDAFSSIAARGAQLASGFAPRLSGRLAGDVRGNRARSKAVITAGRAGLPYAGPINYGWAAHNITAAGFMQKADRALQPLSLRLLEDSINRAIRRRGLA